MVSQEALHQELRKRIRGLPGIHEDAFFVGRTMFMHIHGLGHYDIRLSKRDQARVLASEKARPHRWAPEAGYVTVVVDEERDLQPAMDLILLSHQHFAGKQNAPPNGNE